MRRFCLLLVCCFLCFSVSSADDKFYVHSRDDIIEFLSFLAESELISWDAFDAATDALSVHMKNYPGYSYREYCHFAIGYALAYDAQEVGHAYEDGYQHGYDQGYYDCLSHYNITE